MTPGLSEPISDAILYDETIRQRVNDGTPFANSLADTSISPGMSDNLSFFPWGHVRQSHSDAGGK